MTRDAIGVGVCGVDWRTGRRQCANPGICRIMTGDAITGDARVREDRLNRCRPARTVVAEMAILGSRHMVGGFTPYCVIRHTGSVRMSGEPAVVAAFAAPGRAGMIKRCA